jgi:ATP-dependent exoDNAse (exonuclease V) beta subunit
MTASRAAPKDGAARLRAVEARGSVLVQAPAGSGKTTLLTQRYLRLLAGVDAPECILALTFTRRAAEEMRERVIRALQAAALEQCPADLNPQTWGLAVAARRHLQARRFDVERHPSRLRIETIDSFNAWLAVQLPIASGAGGRLSLLDNARPLYEEAARRALLHEGSDPYGAAVERVLAVGDQRWSDLVGLIVDMLPGRDRWLPLLAGRLQAASALEEPQLARVRRHFDEDLELLVVRALRGAHEALGSDAIDRLSPLLHAAANRCAGARTEFAPWEGNATPLRPDLSDLERWRGIAALLVTKGNDLRKQVTKSDGFPSACAQKAPMMRLLSEFAGRPRVLPALIGVRMLPAAKYSDADWARVRDVARLLVFAAAELEAVFREQGVVDFPAVSMAALRALGTLESPTDLCLRLDYRLQHLLLDEFQDTSSAQLALVRLLTAGWQRDDGRSVFCVGDPMQSIYGFRQAEVRAFLELAEEGIGEVRFDVQRLSSNFRSDRSIVDWINGCFERVMPRADDRERGAIAFRASDAALPPSPQADGAVSVRSFDSTATEACAIADLVQERHATHPGWHIAILVRARSHAREIARGLRARGIAFRATEIEPLQDRPSVRDLVMLIGALLHLGNRVAWLAVLRAPWAGLSLEDLLVLSRAAPVIWDALCDEAVLGRLSEDGRARCRRLRPVFENAFGVQTHTSIARWVERVWLALGGPGCAMERVELDYVRVAFARLRELERRGMPDAADLTRSFADLYADGGPASAVEIMTIHKAKGLEFDMVIVPALNRRSRAARGQLLLMHQFARTERDGMVMAARPAIGTQNDRLFEFLRREAREAAQLEAQRLLYVACTRAKRRLYLTATLERDDPDDAPGDFADESAAAADMIDDEAAAGAARAAPGQKPTFKEPYPGSLLAVLWPIIGPEFAASAASIVQGSAPGPAAAGGGLRGGALRRVPLDWSAEESVSDAFSAPIQGSGALREETPVFDWAGETARRIGSLVHAELQVLDPGRGVEALVRGRDAHFQRWLALHGVPAERLRDASERVMSALLAVQRDPRGRWIFRGGYREDFREYAVSGRSGGEVVRAVFDRTFIDENGIRWVIDYKTSRHAGGGLEEFLDREVERYRPQLERYALLARKLGPEPVRVGLYFPLMSAWREWSPEAPDSGN